jgi:uncharacterized protein YacL
MKAAIAFGRVALVVVSGLLGLRLASTTGLPAVAGFLGGAMLGVLAVLLEMGTARVPFGSIVLGAVAISAGIVAGLLGGTAVAALAPDAGGAARGFGAVLGGYLGTAIALARRGDLELLADRAFPERPRRRLPGKVLDTSVIIDGRIIDVCEAGFVEGPLIVPQFVLRELQQIADSPDGLKRNRGKRGFDVLERLQRSPKATVIVDERDFPNAREVDRKLIELARAVGAKIVTNDYNLDRVAELSGVTVLNVNELANALKPVVLPGEVMHVRIQREGKESGQGVAYLDDGTMVVVDHGRKHVGQSIDVTVTSVLQTTAGRMIFSRPRDEE